MATNTGSIKAYPIIKVSGPGAFYRVSNITTGHRIDFDLILLTGEIVVLDLRPGAKTLTSSFRGAINSAIVPGSDTNDFHLIPGNNDISIFIDDATATVQMTWPEKHASWAGIASNEV